MKSQAGVPRQNLCALAEINLSLGTLNYRGLLFPNHRLHCIPKLITTPVLINRPLGALMGVEFRVKVQRIWWRSREIAQVSQLSVDVLHFYCTSLLTFYLVHDSYGVFALVAGLQPKTKTSNPFLLDLILLLSLIIEFNTVRAW